MSGRRAAAAGALLPAGLALVASLAWSWRPSYWLDETATVSAVGRPVPALLAMLHRVDAVHGVFYLLLWPWARAGHAEWWLGRPGPRWRGRAAPAAGVAAWVLVAAMRLIADRRKSGDALVFAMD